MRLLFLQLAIAISAVLPDNAGAAQVSGAKAGWTILCPHPASTVESLAAREVRRYVYLRTGQLLPV